MTSFSEIKCPLNDILKSETDADVIDRNHQSAAALQAAQELQDEQIREIVVHSFKDSWKHIYKYKIQENSDILDPPQIKIKFYVSKDESNLEEEENSFYENFLWMDKDNIIKCAISTLTQSKSIEWTNIRRVRITGTKAHDVKTRKDNFESLAERFCKKEDFKGNSSTHYGTVMEKVVAKKYSERTGKPLTFCGVIVCGHHLWLSFSPDGFVKDDDGRWKLVEIKCPLNKKE
jgi:hypothetical protein